MNTKVRISLSGFVVVLSIIFTSVVVVGLHDFNAIQFGGTIWYSEPVDGECCMCGEHMVYSGIGYKITGGIKTFPKLDKTGNVVYSVPCNTISEYSLMATWSRYIGAGLIINRNSGKIHR